MTNRVLLGSTVSGRFGLRVSRPGFDVTNAALTGQQLSFDSSWLTTAVIQLSGAVSVPTGTFAYTSVSFGTTFPSVPAVIAYADRSGVQTPIQIMGAFGPYSGWFDDGAFTAQPIRVYTNRVEFVQLPTAAGGAYVARYIIMRPF